MTSGCIDTPDLLPKTLATQEARRLLRPFDWSLLGGVYEL
jgi:hypothetical protein